jgi:hypothetical protein
VIREKNISATVCIVCLMVSAFGCVRRDWMVIMSFIWSLKSIARSSNSPPDIGPSWRTCMGESKRKRLLLQGTQPPMDGAAAMGSLTIAIRTGLDKSTIEQTREEIVQHFLWWVTTGLKENLDLAKQHAIGLPEVEAFLEALVVGGSHPALEKWQDSKQGCPPPSGHLWRARRLIVLLAVALHRTGWGSKEAAQEFAAREATRTEVFADRALPLGQLHTGRSVNRDSVQATSNYWQRRLLAAGSARRKTSLNISLGWRI